MATRPIQADDKGRGENVFLFIPNLIGTSPVLECLEGH